MREEKFNNKIEIEALLNTYSVKDITNTFTHIDNKLMSLYECSADDFLRLNSDFKNLFKQSKVISDNVDTIFDIFNANKNKELYTEIHNFYNGLKEQAEIFDQKISVTIKFLEELSNLLRFIFFPIKQITVYLTNPIKTPNAITYCITCVSSARQPDTVPKLR